MPILDAPEDGVHQESTPEKGTVGVRANIDTLRHLSSQILVPDTLVSDGPKFTVEVKNDTLTGAGSVKHEDSESIKGVDSFPFYLHRTTLLFYSI